MLIENETRLKTWISQVVEDISDAEPDALAKYVIALIKKPLSDTDLEKLCTDKLSVFLQSHTEEFVSRLFETLKSGQYLPKANVLSSAEPPKSDLQNKLKVDQKSAAEHDELVLTDGESDHDQEKEEALPQKPTKKHKDTSQQLQLNAKAVSVLSSPRSAPAKEQPAIPSPRRSAASEQRSNVRATASPQCAVAVAAVQPTATNARPPRKRISPPPRSASMERRAANRRSPPMRRRVVLTGGGGGGSMRISSSNRLMVVDRERERHHRGGTGGGGGSGRGTTVAGKSRSKSRSPHRKEKRLLGVEPEPRITSSRRHRCRDFHEKGFCMRGDNCPFDHGPDPVVVENSALKEIVRDTAIFDTSTAYGVNPPPPGLENTVTPSAVCVGKLSGGITEGYNPEAPSMDASSTVSRIDFSVPPPPLPQHFLQQQRQLVYPSVPPTAAAGILPTFPGAAATTTLADASGGGVLALRPAVEPPLGGGALRGPLPSTITVSVSGSQPTYGGAMSVSAATTAPPNGSFSTFQQDNGGRMAMRGGRFKPYTMAIRNPTTRNLLVRKIPPELNKIAQIDQHFSRFGQVTNIQVQYEGRIDSALVTFKTRRDAMAAYKSTEPIFNNRFVKVFWQNDINGNTIENEGIGGGGDIGENASNGPTIPLVDSNRKTLLKEPIQFPRYFTKVFAPQKKDDGDGSGASAEEPPTVAAMPSADDKKAFPADHETVEHSQSVPGVVAAAASHNQHLSRPTYNSKLAISKKRAAVERDRFSKLADVQRMKTELYTKLVEQQKNLLKKLQQTEDKETKKKIVKYLKTFELKVKGVKTELEQLALKLRELQVRQQPPAKKWAAVAKNDKDIVPDGERKPSEQVTAKDLLASLEFDEEEEEDDEKEDEEEEALSDKAED